MKKSHVFSLCSLFILISILASGQDKSIQKFNTLSSKEKKEGWKLLFDGKTFSGWRGLGRDHVPIGLWIVEDGMIRKLKSSSVKQLPDGRPVENGDLMTIDTYNDFELVFEWKIDKGGNSGLKYNVSEELCKQNGSEFSALGFEYQMLDDADPQYKNLKPSQYSGSLYDLIPAKNINLKPVGEFNTSRIIVKGNGEHWLNGIKVVEYEFGSKELEDAFLKSKFSKINGFTDKKKAHIVLQNHADEAWFRNIKIRELK
ncbi:MAG TPA: DUF1080 domain-containing protein [Bacteroidales bacterium]|nr:DUF1080 domain-containing protein [Bacteroidales bacterium]